MCCSVATIHQPSIDVFESFDEMLLLKRGGQTIYAGELLHCLCCSTCIYCNHPLHRTALLRGRGSPWEYMPSDLPSHFLGVTSLPEC